jgi:chromosome partitioning protein
LEADGVSTVVIAFANQKGGTGKTTTAVNVAVLFQQAGQRVLIVDMDPQNNVADLLGMADLDEVGAPSLVDVFAGTRSVVEAIAHDERTGLDVLPAGAEARLSGVESGLLGYPAREHWLTRTLDGEVDDYDFVFIDCPPSVGQLTTNAMVAADIVVMPVKLIDLNAVKGATELHRSILYWRAAGLPVPDPVILRDFYNPQRLTVREHEPQVHDLGLEVLDSMLPMTALFDNAIAVGRPHVLREPDHVATSAMRDLAQELITRADAMKAAA